ncbi:unnamed protein product [Vitrella brassicaformis CCMP3155]|uniref:RRM domain-containing protein n=1 Tax=Vitrella brassicaformis (strain CCMP3155) TaxID=1169540 RepID=A0A0G4EBK2_VITBC|nr:unnamed protein product [Vitrella brassicaformis CCMP3155]|eukprot:CEL93014.1 unnamed protein product [Vitrella brassicaformis CCMP3155]
MLAGDIPPNQTLYVSNLNDKTKLPDMRVNLFELFSQFGEILDIQAQKTPSKRGQAFIVFRDIMSATTALRSLQGQDFLEKPLKLAYAKTQSDAVLKDRGTYLPKKRKDQDKGADKQQAQAKRKPTAAAAPPSQAAPGAPHTIFVENLEERITVEALNALFGQYPGFVEARLIEGRHVAFVDYEESMQAEVAMHGLNGFKVTPECELKISWAKGK